MTTPPRRWQQPNGEKFMDFTTREMLENIVEWKHDSRNEDIARMYYRLPWISRVEAGKLCFITGRKGTGKTALASYLLAKASNDTYTTKLSFKEFPLEEMLKESDNGSFNGNRFAAAWEYTIYCATLNCFRNNENIRSDTRDQVRKLFGRGALEDIISASPWSFGVQVSGVGGLNASKSTVGGQPVSWLSKINSARGAIKESIDDSTYYILIDDLDEDYKFFIDGGAKYNELLAGLFRATMSARKFFADIKVKVYPIVFLRADIFAHLSDNNRNSWMDFLKEIEWNQSHIESALGFRIASSPNCRLVPANLGDALGWVLDKQQVPLANNGKNMPPLKFIHRLGQLRVRDSVVFFKLAAEEALRVDSGLIDYSCIRSTLTPFASYMRREIEDEMRAALPKIGEYLRVFGVMGIGKTIFSYSDLEQALTQLKLELRDDHCSAGEIAELLFRFGVIGNLHNNSHAEAIFAYQAAHARLEKSIQLCVQPGISRAVIV
jgi:Uncharacterized conserved protein (DUF2075)